MTLLLDTSTPGSSTLTVPTGVTELVVATFGAEGGTSAPNRPTSWYANGGGAYGYGSLVPSGSVISLPTGWQSGDLAIVTCLETYTTTTPTVGISTGWTLIDRIAATNGSGYTARLTLWYRILQSGDSGPTVTSNQVTSGTYPNAVFTFSSVAGYRSLSTTPPTLTAAAVSTSGNGIIAGPDPSPSSGFNLHIAAAISPDAGPGTSPAWGNGDLSFTMFSKSAAGVDMQSKVYASGDVPSWNPIGSNRVAATAFTFSAEYDPASFVPGGWGAERVQKVAVTPGETLNVFVGARGSDGIPLGVSAADATAGDGVQGSGAGGGYTSLKRGSTVLVSAGGGGGAGGNASVVTRGRGGPGGEGSAGTAGTSGASGDFFLSGGLTGGAGGSFPSFAGAPNDSVFDPGPPLRSYGGGGGGGGSTVGIAGPGTRGVRSAGGAGGGGAGGASQGTGTFVYGRSGVRQGHGRIVVFTGTDGFYMSRTNLGGGGFH